MLIAQARLKDGRGSRSSRGSRGSRSSWGSRGYRRSRGNGGGGRSRCGGSGGSGGGNNLSACDEARSANRGRSWSTNNGDTSDGYARDGNTRGASEGGADNGNGVQGTSKATELSAKDTASRDCDRRDRRNGVGGDRGDERASGDRHRLSWGADQVVHSAGESWDVEERLHALSESADRGCTGCDRGDDGSASSDRNSGRGRSDDGNSGDGWGGGDGNRRGGLANERVNSAGQGRKVQHRVGSLEELASRGKARHSASDGAGSGGTGDRNGWGSGDNRGDGDSGGGLSANKRVDSACESRSVQDRGNLTANDAWGGRACDGAGRGRDRGNGGSDRSDRGSNRCRDGNSGGCTTSDRETTGLLLRADKGVDGICQSRDVQDRGYVSAEDAGALGKVGTLRDRSHGGSNTSKGSDRDAQGSGGDADRCGLSADDGADGVTQSRRVQDGCLSSNDGHCGCGGHDGLRRDGSRDGGDRSRDGRNRYRLGRQSGRSRRPRRTGGTRWARGRRWGYRERTRRPGWTGRAGRRRRRHRHGSWWAGWAGRAGRRGGNRQSSWGRRGRRRRRRRWRRRGRGRRRWRTQLTLLGIGNRCTQGPRAEREHHEAVLQSHLSWLISERKVVVVERVDVVGV